MSIILTDSRRIGCILRYARIQNHMNPDDLAKLLKTSRKDIKMFERGTKVIDERIMMQIFIYGMTLMKARNIRCISQDKK